MQFYPAAEYAESKLEFEIEGGKFVASGRELLKPGWRVLVRSSKKESDVPFVPALEQGQILTCREGEITAKKTEPPKHFTEATLLQAMTGIARFVQDNGLKKILRNTDGLGTEATRAVYWIPYLSEACFQEVVNLCLVLKQEKGWWMRFQTLQPTQI
ncbi:DNA topoisomerase III [Vibrio sp. JCM 19236]|nr:DNA topoisomerase III [Vibrio sp. JCM 19236]